MPVSTVNDIDIYWEEHGPKTGPRVLFIGGSGGDLRKTPNVFDGPLTRHARVLSYDQRGLGRTSKPDAPYTMAQYADDAAGLLDAAGWDMAHVVGASFGGMVAQHLVARHPDRVKKLVLCCTSPGGDGGSSYPLHEVASMEEEDRIRFMMPISDTRHTPAWQTENAELVDKLVRMQIDGESPFRDEPRRAEGALWQLEARKDHDAWEGLSTITQDVLVCGGKSDGIATPETQTRIADRIQNATLKMYDGGHLFLVQDPQAWADIIAFTTTDAGSAP
jgi:3-oxoadipate enol-lactonase